MVWAAQGPLAELSLFVELPWDRATIERRSRFLEIVRAIAHDDQAIILRIAHVLAWIKARDVNELERIAEAMQPRLSYLQDAVLGLINAAQTNVLKALSLATIAFVPATLIASIFGMNFDALTWFRADWGPAVAFALMIVAPAGLFVIAKWRRWF